MGPTTFCLQRYAYVHKLITNFIFFHCIYFPQVWLRILLKTRITDIATCRLVSTSWNQYGIRVLRNVHSPIEIERTHQLELFMNVMTGGTIPFTRFRFCKLEFFKFRQESELHLILKFLERHSSDVQAFHFDYPLNPIERPLTFEAETELSTIRSIQTTILSRMPKLEFLALTVHTATLPSWENHPLTTQFNLKKLEILLDREFGPVEIMDNFIEGMIQRSPKLEEFTICDNVKCRNREKEFSISRYSKYLPKWLKLASHHTRIGLRLGCVGDNSKELLQGMMAVGIKLTVLSMNYINFRVKEVSDIFWEWLLQQPLREFGLGYGLNWNECNNGSNIIETCESLTVNHIGDYRNSNLDGFRRLLRNFPNVNRVILGSLTKEILLALGDMLPHLEHLSCKDMSNVWLSFTGLTTNQIYETTAGLEVAKRENPFRKLKGDLLLIQL